MATLELSYPSSTAGLTQGRFTSRWEYPDASSAAFTEPQKQAYTFSVPAVSFRVVMRQAAAPEPKQFLPPWIQPTMMALVGIMSLPENWDSYGGKTLEVELVGLALSTLGSVMQADSPAPSVVPLADGGLQLEWHRRQQDLEIIFSADESPQFVYCNRATGERAEGQAYDTGKLLRLLAGLA